MIRNLQGHMDKMVSNQKAFAWKARVHLKKTKKGPKKKKSFKEIDET